MSVQVEKLEHSMVKLTIEVEAAQFDKACKAAYNKQKNQFNVPGFRKGKVPMNMIEKMYGPEVFYDEAVNTVMNETYGPALDEAGINPVSAPKADVLSCGKGQNMVYTVEVAVKPEVTLGAYKGVEVTELPSEVTEDEVNQKIEAEQKKNARKVFVEDRAVADGDKINLNYAGTVDGVAFDGGTADNYDLTIGSGSFIPGFEEQLVGVMPGSDKDVEVTFPEGYQEASLAGKAAVFACHVNYIETEDLPELDDEFAQEVSEFDTFAEYKASVEAQLAEQKASSNKNAQIEQAIAKIIEASEMDIADAMVEAQSESMLDEFKQQISQYGMKFEDYLQYSNTTEEQMMEQVKPDAINRIQNELVMEAIVKAEGIEVDDEAAEAEYGRMAEMYGMPADQIKNYVPLNAVKADLAVMKARDLIAETMIVVAEQ